MQTRMRELLFCSFFGKWYTGEYFSCKFMHFMCIIITYQRRSERLG